MKVESDVAVAPRSQVPNPRLPVLDALPLLNQAAATEMEANGASPFWARIMRAHAILEDALAKEAAQ
jgi:hypothetical protein